MTEAREIMQSLVDYISGLHYGHAECVVCRTWSGHADTCEFGRAQAWLSRVEQSAAPPIETETVGQGSLTLLLCELPGVLAEGPRRELLEKDDRTSPNEYPDMCLISFEELGDFLSAAQKDQIPTFRAQLSTVEAETVERCANVADGSATFWGGFNPQAVTAAKSIAREICELIDGAKTQGERS